MCPSQWSMDGLLVAAFVGPALLVSASFQQDLWSPHHVVALGPGGQQGPETGGCAEASAANRRGRGVPSLTRAGLCPLYQRGQGMTPRPEQVTSIMGAPGSHRREHEAQEEEGKGPSESRRIASEGQGRREQPGLLRPSPPLSASLRPPGDTYLVATLSGDSAPGSYESELCPLTCLVAKA